MRLLCVLLPHFPLMCEMSRHPAIKSCTVVITQSRGSQKLVYDYTPELEDLQPGVPLQQALSRHGEIQLLHADIPYYWSTFSAILDALETRSPLVEGTELGCAYIGLDGLQLIYRDDKTLVNAIKEVIPEAFAAQIGIAAGKFLAYLAALRSPAGSYKVLTGDIRVFLKDLPCDVLPVSAKSKNKLSDFGIRTLWQVAALPTGPLQSQFGPEGKRIRELAMGHDNTPLYPRFMEEVIDENAALSSVTVSLEAILVTLESLLSKVFARDTLRGRGIRNITLWGQGWSASDGWERNIQFKEPAMDIKSIISRIKRVMENSPPPGPVERLGVRIRKNGLGYKRGRQKSIFSEVRAKDSLAEDIKQLELRLDSPQVFRIKEVEPWSRIPERRYALTPLDR